jgi:hypothetical protein
LGDGIITRVECLASQRYPERPLRFIQEDELHQVAEIKSESRTPQGYTFTIQDQTGKTYQLSYDETKHEWTVKAWK